MAGSSAQVAGARPQRAWARARARCRARRGGAGQGWRAGQARVETQPARAQARRGARRAVARFEQTWLDGWIIRRVQCRGRACRLHAECYGNSVEDKPFY